MMRAMCFVFILVMLVVVSHCEAKVMSRERRAVNTDEQPKMVTNNGHLIFQTGTNHNITFKTGGGNGRIVIDTFDLVEMAKMVKTNKEAITAIQQSPAIPQDLQTNMNQLTQDVQDLKSRVESLERNEVTVPPDLQLRVTSLESQVRLLNNDLSTNECNSSPCQNGGTCINLYQSFQCRCKPGFQGRTCSDDVNECAVISGTEDACQNGGSCINNRGSYTCRCTPNWYGLKCTIQYDDCSSAPAAELCGHGYCVDISRTQTDTSQFDCICFDGWQRDSNSNNPACTIDVDECQGQTYPCSSDPHVNCINIPESYYCGVCPTGYTGNGYTCSDIDECQNNNGGCSLAPLVQCINTKGSRTCAPCPAGYVGNGEVCVFVGVCHMDNGGCSALAICTETAGVPGGRVCTCPHGFYGTGEGFNGCIQSGGGGGGGGGATTCNDNPCVNGRCTSTGVASYHCDCDLGWEGLNCDEDIDECASNPCRNSGTCTHLENSYTCSCTSGFGGINCEDTLYVCGAWLGGSSGEFEFPGAGNTYPHGASCAWVITIPQSERVIQIEFPRFDLEEEPDCNYDFLQINDGNTAASHPIGRYCNGQPPPDSITSTHDQLYFWFKSDSSVAHGGFKISWRSADPVCGGELVGSNHGTINSPGYPGDYPNSRDCVWRVTVEAGHYITFAFGTLRLEHHDSCDYDYLEIHDGLEEDAASLGKFCSTVLPAPVRTSGPYATVRFHSDSTEQDTGFHITYTSLSTEPGCGGIFTDDLAVIISPNYPNVYPDNAECIWTVQVTEGDTVTFEITDLTIEEHLNCVYDYVEVRDGFDETAPFVGRYCHSDSIPPPFRSTGNTLWIKFRSDGSVGAGGFRATYETYCGGLYTESPGEIISPHFPDSYGHNRECEYVITAEQGFNIQLTFITFDIEGHEDCSSDFLEVRNGATAESNLLQMLCGSALPPPITGTSNSMYLKFSTDGSVSNYGFRASYEFVDASPNGCGGFFTDHVGIFSSPSHPDTYPHGIHCVYTIQVEAGNSIRLTFNSFNLEYDYNCGYDYVAIYDNTTTSQNRNLGRFCGSTPPPITTSEGNIMSVVFSTDYSVAREGFTASYVSLDAASVCGGDLRGNTGVISSPGYPGYYPNNIECIWTITADSGILIQINFTYFQLEGSNDCPFDFVEIRNGGYPTSPLIGKFCGTSIVPTSFVSHSNRMYIRFLTDGSITYTGFSLTYDATATGCGGTLTSPTGSFLSPNYPYSYHHNAECFWLINVSEGSHITLMFADMDLEGHSSCYYDYVKVFDGELETDPLLGTFCGTEIPPPIESSSSQIRVKLRTDYSVSGRGFHAAYVTNCDNVILTARSGAIESTNFPQPYPHNRDCFWVIQTTLGNQINITFNNLVLEDHGSCVYDYVKIYDGDTVIAPLLDTLCGTPNIDGIAYTSTGNYLGVEFHSDYSVAAAGFRASYISYGCGGDLTGNTGQLMSPGYPSLYPHSMECHWSIVVSYGHSITLTIHHIDMEEHSQCRYDALEVYSGRDADGLQLTQVCHTQTTTQQVSTTGNAMFILFRADRSVNGQGFNATYQSIDGGCGGNFTSPTGTISSVNYPEAYNHNTDCTWSVTVDERKRINLTFVDFQLEGSGCIYDYVNVYDGPSEAYPLILNHCGYGLPSPVGYFTSRNEMFIRMRADGSVSMRGFSAEYTTVCGGRLDAAPGGVITSDNYPNRYPRGQNCSWIIESANPVDRITLVFTFMNVIISDDCVDNAITVHNGNDESAPLVGRYCGSQVPAPLVSFGAALTVVFQSSNSYQRGTGFRATYTTSISACGGEYTSYAGAFASPGFPDSYPTDTECVWTIPSSPGNRIHVAFTLFALQDTPGCTADYLEIRNQDETGSLIGRYCGSQSFPSNATSYGTMWIRFYSDNTTISSGFSAQYGHVFGGTLTAPGGQIASPLYPRPYLSNLNVIWIILVMGGNRIRATFLQFSLVNFLTGVCQFDFVALFDGPNRDSAELLRACGNEIPLPVESSGNAMIVEFRTDGFRVNTGFLLEWAEILETPGSECGQTIPVLDTKANFTSPGYPYGYEQDLDCRWILESPVGTTIMLNITDMGIEYESQCEYDSVQVYDGLTTDMRNLGKFCGRVSPGPVHSFSNALLVVFSTDFIINNTGFVATYQTYCGGFYTVQHGIISSPLYPLNYPANQNCTWIVQVQDGYTIQVDFQRLDIQSSSVCQMDYLELKNGLELTSPPLGNGRYCGSFLPASLETASNTLRLQFVSDGSQNRPGFQISFLALQEGCGGQLVLTDADIRSSGYEIKSPNYPGNYPTNMECVWIISAPATQAIQLDFQSPFAIQYSSEELRRIIPTITPTLTNPFRLSSSNPQDGTLDQISCEIDYLEVRDGGTENAPRLARLCGSTLPNTIKSSSNALFVKFRSSFIAAESAGFKFLYNIATCGGTYSGTEGTITSPGFPDNYDSDLDCMWYLLGPVGHYMTFTFSDLNIAGNSDNCGQGDFLEIYNGRNASAPRLSQLCSSNVPTPVDTSDSFAFIRFKSDSSGVASGFRLQYSSSVDVCGGDLVTPTGTLNSPNYPGLYAHSRVCEWRITVADGYLVTLRFQNMDLEETSGCYYDSVEVYNGLQSDSPRIGAYCGTNPPVEVQSSGNHMRVVFISDGSVTGGGFLANYDSLDASVCGGIKSVTPGDAETTIFSPGYGVSNYTSNLECEWVIQNTASTNTSLYLTWDDGFNLFGFQNLQDYCHLADYVELRSGSDISGDLIGRYCSDEKPDDLIIPYRSVYVKFVSSALSGDAQFAGFRMGYSATNCGGIVSGTDGVITSPNYPDYYNDDYQCAWLLMTQEGTTITLTFTDFAIETHTTCGFDRVYAYNGATRNSPQISGENPWCGQTAPDPVTSSSNQLLLIFQTDGNARDRGFRLEWTTHQRGCGGNLHGNEGTISSVNYPNQYSSNSECIWTITVETGYHVILTFNPTFDIRSGDSVTLYDGNTDSSQIIGTYTGNTAPAAQKSSLNTLRVRIQSDASNEGSGFQASWSTGCGATFNNVTMGRIVSPGYPNRDYPSNSRCGYVINWEADKKLALHFEDLFEIDGSVSFCLDRLEMYAGVDNTSTLLGQFCGDVSPGVIQTTGSAYLYFYTDGYGQGDGFAVTFAAGCGGVYTGPEGIIQTPTYELYRQNQNCTWLITVSNNRSIELKFTMFDLDTWFYSGGSACLYDHVEVLDGDNFGAPSLTGRLCGTNVLRRPVYSTGQSLFITFISGDLGIGEGFRAVYREVFGPTQGCGGNILQASGSLSSLDADNDGAYENNLHCAWYLSVEANKIVQLDFGSLFNIEYSQTGEEACIYDYVEVRDGYGELAPLVGRFCGITAPSPITLSVNQAYILFHSDDATGRSGFTINYSSADPVCGGTFNATDTPQTITSPNYRRCSWVVSSPDDYTHVRIRVTALDIEEDINCNNDYLELRDYPLSNGDANVRYCGNNIPPVFDSSTHAVHIYFITDASSHGNGFSLQYYIADCNHNYTTDNGRLRSPGQAEHYHNNHECDIYITTANNTYISLYFNSFNVENHPSCQYDYLNVYNGSDVNAPLISQLCGDGLPNPIFATGNQVYLKFYTDYSVTDSGFDITYTSSTTQGCGGNLSGRQGSFTSPMYPSTYPTNQNCEWSIEVTAGGQPVSLELSYINIEGQEGICNNDRIEVYDGQDSSASLFGNYCGTRPPAVMTASNNGRFMFVRFISDGATAGNNTYTGFRARFSS